MMGKDDGKTNTAPAAMPAEPAFAYAPSFFARHALASAEFNSVPYEAKLMLDAALEDADNAPSTAEAAMILVEAAGCVAGHYNAIAAMLGEAAKALHNVATTPAPVAALPETSASSTPSPTSTTAPAPTAAPVAAAPMDVDEVARGIVEQAMQEVADAPSPVEAAAYLRSASAAARATSPTAAQYLDAFALTLENRDILEATEACGIAFGKLDDAASRNLAQNAIDEVADAPTAPDAILYLRDVAKGLEPAQPRVAECLHAYVRVIQATASNSAAHAAT